MSHNTPRLCFIGFGEAGQAFASGLRTAGVTTMAAWDILVPEAGGAKVRGGGDGRRGGSSPAAPRAGVEPQIITSLSKSFPGLDWPKIVAYNLERMANHGTRRA